MLWLTVMAIGKIFNTGFHSTGFDVCIVCVITQFERIDLYKTHILYHNNKPKIHTAY